MNAKPDRIKLAIAAVMLSGLAGTFGDSIAKFISDEISLWQILFSRALFGVCAFALLLRASRDKISLMPISLFWVLMRSLALTVNWLLFYVALVQVHISLLAALLFTFPVFILLLAPIFGGDKVRGKNWLAIGLAVVGMLCIVRPTPNHFNMFALLGLGCAFFYGGAMLITRAKLTGENSKVVSLWQNTAYAITGGIGLIVMAIWQPQFAADNHFYFGGWEWLTALQWGIIVAMSAAFFVNVVTVVFAYQNAPSPTVATFEYFFVLSALFWGWLILSEKPDYLDLTGIAVIAVAGIIIVRNPAKR